MNIMRRTITFLLITGIISFNNVIQAQTDPGTANLVHQWTFDDGTANDGIATDPVNGTLEGGATIVNYALKLNSQGDYVSFSGPDMAINTYATVTQEIWYTSVAGANSGYTMLSYFGKSNGYNYISTSTARGDDISYTAITDGTYNSEVGAAGPEYDDGLLHHMVSIVSTDSVILYLDGELIAKTKHSIPFSSVNNALAFLGKSGYTADPTWIGTISMFSIYNKKLNADEVKYLFELGPEQAPIIFTSATAINFDDIITTSSFTVSGLNLSDPITITAPPGLTISETELAADTTNAIINVTYDGVTAVDSAIILVSGGVEVELPVKSVTNDCYSPLYADLTNLNDDPYVSSLNNFDGWGVRSINTNPDFVYCGASSGNVSDGSLDIPLTGLLLPSTQYRVKAKVYAVGGSFQVGVLGWSSGSGDYIHLIKTTDSWQDVDFIFTTGSSLGAPPHRVFFNSVGLTGKSGYIDNWEVFAVPNIYTSASSLNFITPSLETVTIRGVNLTDDITLTAPSGFTLSSTTLTPNANGEEITVTYEGASTTDGYIYLTSGSITDSLYVSGSIDPTFITSVDRLVVDEISDSNSFMVSGYNLTSNVTLTAPDGITLSEYNLPSTVMDKIITVKYDGVANSSGVIKLTSGTYTFDLNLQAQLNEDCFTLLYTDRENLITDPTCNSFTAEGEGTRMINSDPAFVYCGARSAQVVTSGSIERNLTGVLKPNTSYRMRAKLYKKSPAQDGNMGHITYTLALDSAANPTNYNLIKTAMDSACYYYNKYTPFINNIYVYYNAGIPTAQAGYLSSIGFGPNTRYMWVGTAMHEMAHYFGSGTTSDWQEKMVGGKWTGSVANELIKEITNGSTETVSGDNNSSPVHYWPYGINQKEEITNLGSEATQVKALSDMARLVKAMLVDDTGLPTNNPAVGLGVFGWDDSNNDIYKEVYISNSWQDIDITFTTGANLDTKQGVFFNGGTGYIDNWELYDLSEITGINNTVTNIASIEVYPTITAGDVTINFKDEPGTFQVYSITGIKLMEQTTAVYRQGIYLQSKGIYLIKLKTHNNEKLVKIVVQ